MVRCQDIDVDSCFATDGLTGNAIAADAMETDAMENNAMETDVMETSTRDDTTKDKKICFILFRKFVKEVCHRDEATLYNSHVFSTFKILVRMKQYKDDLLASCLQLLLSLPKELVEMELDGLVQALQVSK